MSDDTITKLPDPSGFGSDPFTAVLRDGARKLIEQAIHAELAALLTAFAAEKLEDGRARLVRHGYLPEREVMTGIGPVPVTVPRIRDRKPGADKITFTPSILPRYLRKAKSVEEVLPWLYLKGLSTGDFSEALAALLGPNAKGLSATTITRLKADWWSEYEAWEKRDLGARRFLYIWADGVYFKPRMAEEKQCVLVVVGADEYGRKELLAMTDGFRESTQSWREVLLDLKRRGLKQDPKLAVGDGALGFWAALEEVYPTTTAQRCWMHKTGNVLNYLPKSVQEKAKQGIHDIWMAEGREEAEQAFDAFVERFDAKYPKATECLGKDRESLLAFYDFPAEHWTHIRTTNVIESSFATIRHRSRQTKGCVTRSTMLTMIFKMGQCAEGSWRKLRGFRHLAKVIEGVKFKDGIEVTEDNKAAA